MTRPSFSTQLATLWALVAGICAVLVALIWFMATSGESQQIAAARLHAASMCDAVSVRYSRSASLAGSSAANIDLMHAVLDTVLAQSPGVEGGFWSRAVQPGIASAGFLAYAFPTYEGSGIKRDIPDAETPLILHTLRSSASTHGTASNVISNGPDAVVAVACPVTGAENIFAWMLTRTRPPLGQHGETLVWLLAGILATLLGMALAVTLMLRRWKSKLTRLELALSAEPGTDAARPARLAHLGERDLDVIVGALNRYLERNERLQQQMVDLGRKLAREEHFAALGKLAAQLAHEIRNPAGAMRLKAENALAGSRDRQEGALRFMLDQLGRIESQVASLLALTQPIKIDARPVCIAPWLAKVVESHRELAQQRRVTLTLVARFDQGPGVDSAPPQFDEEQLRRALDNLLLNALRHVPEGGVVTVVAARELKCDRPSLRIDVLDDGAGVPPGQRECIFEPFVTGRPDGSGLGLSIVREVASAHGGRAYLDESPSGACFVIEIPWQPFS
ncbi:sensor histidine kinase [Paraburkholderia nodosa]|uniref:sensor histidine kinase n=1 Tax=Paraburkholderia nodosa TaxID=392320 RepID=UPI00047F2EEA|nr:HAMP domain-containing sensor histidine kinase [Paraburkholderia nodosa]